MDVDRESMDQAFQERWEAWVARAGAWQKTADLAMEVIFAGTQPCGCGKCVICVLEQRYVDLGGGVKRKKRKGV